MRQFQLCCKVPSWSSKSGRLLCFSPGSSFCHIKTAVYSAFLVLTNNTKILKQKFRERNAFLFQCLLLPPSPFLPSLIFLSILKASVGHRDQGSVHLEQSSPCGRWWGRSEPPHLMWHLLAAGDPPQSTASPEEWGCFTLPLAQAANRSTLSTAVPLTFHRTFDWLGIIFL